MARNTDKGLEAHRLLNDPAYNEAFERMEQSIVHALATIVMDGSPETNNLIVEKVRDLQANRRLRASLTRVVGYSELEEKRQEDAQSRPSRAQDPRWR